MSNTNTNTNQESELELELQGPGLTDDLNKDLPGERKPFVLHISPAIDENCDHDWIEGDDGNPERCSKCGLSFMRYVFLCCP